MTYQQDLKDAERVGQQALADYQSGKGLSSADYEQAGKAAESLVQDYAGSRGSGGAGSSAVEGALKDFGSTSVGREIEQNVAKQAIKSEAKNALEGGNFGSISKLAEDALNK